MSRVTLVTVGYWDLDNGVAGTLYYGTAGFVTGKDDTPASTVFDARLEQPGRLKRAMFGDGSSRGRSVPGTGEAILGNGDGLLDGLRRFAFDSRTWTEYEGPADGTFPTDFEAVLVATVEEPPQFKDETIRFALRDRHAETHVPLQATKYAGTGGLEGGADLEGKPKPYCLGDAYNVPLVLVDPQKLIYQAHAGALTSVGAVRDRGIALGPDLNSWLEQAGYSGAKYAAVRYIVDSNGNKRTVAVGQGGAVGQYNGTTWSDLAGTADWSTSDMYAIGFDVDTGWHLVGGAAGELWSYAQYGLTSGVSESTNFGASAIRAAHYWKEQDLWILCGDDGKIDTAPGSDGPENYTWTSETSGVTKHLYAIATSETLAVIVGQDGTILTSTGNGTWATRSSGFGTSDIFAIARAKDRFVIGGEANKFGVSDGGLVWTVVTGAFTIPGETVADTCRGITVMHGRFVAVGDDALVATSLWGDRWTLVAAIPGADERFNAITLHEDTDEPFAAGENTLASESTVYGGVGPKVYASQAAIEDIEDPPPEGTYGYWLAGGLIRLGSRPAGLVTGDVVQGATAGDRTAGQLFAAVMTKIGLGSDYSTADVTALDALRADVCGFWSGLEEWRASDVLDLIAASVEGWWGADELGVFRIAVGPSTDGVSVLAIPKEDMGDDGIAFLPTRSEAGLPSHTVNVQWRKNYAPSSDLAFGVEPADRALLEKQWRIEPASDSSVLTAHPLAKETPIETLLQTAAGASSSATRWLARLDSLAEVVEIKLELRAETQGSALKMGDVVTPSYDRWSLEAGVDYAVIGIERDRAAKEVTIQAWRAT